MANSKMSETKNHHLATTVGDLMLSSDLTLYRLGTSAFKRLRANAADEKDKTTCGLCYAPTTEPMTSTLGINPENEQKAITTLACADCAGDAAAQMAMTLTTRYHNWHSATSDMLQLVDDAETAEEAKEYGDEYITLMSAMHHSSRDLKSEATALVDEAVSEWENNNE